MANIGDLANNRVNRRSFLGVLAVGGSVSILAACGQPPSEQKPAAPAPTTAPAAPAPTKPPAAPEPTKPAAAPAAPAPTTAPAPAATQPAQAAPGKPGGPVTVKFMTWWWAEAGRNEAWRTTIKKFHAAQNDIRVEEVGFPYSEYFQKIMTQVAGGRLDADVLSFADDLAVRLIQSKVLEPCDDVANKLGVKDKLEKVAHDFVTVGGKLYGILAPLGKYALIYNTDLYKKAGISKPPTTQEEYIEVATKATKRPDIFGHAARSTMAEQNGWWQDITHWVLGYDGVWAKAKKPLVTEAPVINAIKAYKRLYDGAMPQGADASTYRRMVWEGKVVQYVDNIANMNIIKSGNADTYSKILTAPPPWPNKKSIALPSYVGIYAGSKNIDAAKAWWQWVYAKENLGPLMEAALDIIPPYEGALREEFLKSLPWTAGYLAANGVIFAATVEGFEANIAEFRQITLQKVSEVLTAGKAPEVAMKEAQTELEALASRIQ